MSELFPDEIDDAHWDEAHRRANVIRRFLNNRADSPTASDVPGARRRTRCQQGYSIPSRQAVPRRGDRPVAGGPQTRPTGGSPRLRRRARGDHPKHYQRILPNALPTDGLAAGPRGGGRTALRQSSNRRIAEQSWLASKASTSRSVQGDAANPRSQKAQRRFLGHSARHGLWKWSRSTTREPISLSSTKKPGNRSEGHGLRWRWMFAAEW